MRTFFTDWLRRKHHYDRYAIVRELLGPARTNLLDVGCARPCAIMEDGSFLRFLGYGQGVDIKDIKVDFTFGRASVTNLPFRDHSFDVVTAIEVLEHVEDLDSALRSIHRVLRKGGVFVITTPSNNLLFRFVWFFWQRYFGREWEHSHIKVLKKGQWIELLSRYFTIVETVDYWNVNIIVKATRKD